MADRRERLRILLIDDDPNIVRLVQAMLQAHHFAPAAVVGSGREAMRSMEGIDIVLLDQQLPDTNGIELLEAIRSRPTPPAVVLITAHGNESLAATALRRGADDYLAKDPSLTEMLPQILERVRRTRELRKALVAVERDLVRAERLAAIGEIAVTLHHEINNPLMAAFADVELLLADSAAPESRRQALESVMESLCRIRDIVRRIGSIREVRAKSYLPGIRMVDLEAGEREGAGVRRGTALVMVPDEDLARIVSLLLRHAGFDRRSGLSELQDAVACQLPALVLVAASAAPGAHPLAGFEAPSERGYAVVALVIGEGAAAYAAGADRVFELPFDPGTFTSEIIEVMLRR
jgi:DNA-binding response OmpR family regulator